MPGRDRRRRTVESVPGEGTTVIGTIPAASAPSVLALRELHLLNEAYPPLISHASVPWTRPPRMVPTSTRGEEGHEETPSESSRCSAPSRSCWRWATPRSLEPTTGPPLRPAPLFSPSDDRTPEPTETDTEDHGKVGNDDGQVEDRTTTRPATTTTATSRARTTTARAATTKVRPGTMMRAGSESYGGDDGEGHE